MVSWKITRCAPRRTRLTVNHTSARCGREEEIRENGLKVNIVRAERERKEGGATLVMLYYSFLIEEDVSRGHTFRFILYRKVVKYIQNLVSLSLY